MTRFPTLLLFASLVACNTGSGTAPAPAPGAPVEAPAPSGEAEQAAAATATALPDSIAAGGPFSGSVLETMNSAGYTYMLLDTGEARVWVAAQEMGASLGDRVDVAGGPVMRSFHSNTLDRTFDAIVFASQARVSGSAPPIPEGEPLALPAGHPPIPTPGHPPVEGAPAEGSR